MEHSGDVVDLSGLEGIKVDKHSTGGVGDKTSLAVVPIVASLGVPVAKMSGRGLGHTGGTLDKLESIPGLTTGIDRERFFHIVREHGAAIIGQTGNLVPADKLIYALRDVTATVDSIPVIASSIMSKKLAAGSDRILLDVKTGSGAFMKDLDAAIDLARAMVSIGEEAERETVALITNMNRPLGHAIGNALEVIEVVETLRGHGPEDLARECCALAAEMLVLGERASTIDEGRALAEQAIANGSAFRKLCEIVAAQGGDVGYLENTSRFGRDAIAHEVAAPRDGYLGAIDTTAVGTASVELRAGREKKDDPIDHLAGITLLKNQGDAVRVGETVAVLHTADAERLSRALPRSRQPSRSRRMSPNPNRLRPRDRTRRRALRVTRWVRHTCWLFFSHRRAGGCGKTTRPDAAAPRPRYHSLTRMKGPQCTSPALRSPHTWTTRCSNRRQRQPISTALSPRRGNTAPPRCA